MMNNNKKIQNGNKIILLTSLLIFFVLIISLSAQAYYDPNTKFSCEVLLNKNEITYDLTPLENYAINGSVKIIEIKDEESLGSSNSIAEEEPEEKLIKDFKHEYDWDPGTYYLYRSHFNHDLAVIVHEVDDYIEFINLSGLSLTLTVPTTIGEITIEWKTVTLNINFELELNNSLTKFMENQGYEESGTTEVNEKLVGLVFSKKNLDIFISVGEGGKTDKGSLNPGESIIWAEGPSELINDRDSNNEIKKMLEFLTINPDEWEKATHEKHSRDEMALIPSVNIDPNKLNWGNVVSYELNWLLNQSIIKGLSNNDIKEIVNKAESGKAGFNARLIHYNDSWMPYYESGLSLETGDESFGINLKDLPSYVPGEFEEEADKDLKNNFQIFLIYIFVIIIILSIMIFSYTRLKKKYILKNLNRKNIFELIKAKPGIYFNELLRELDIKPGALSYHLNVLERKEYIKSIQDSSYRRFYLFGAKSDFKLVLTNVQQRIISVINDRPGISQVKISKSIGSNKMVVNYNVKILCDAGLIALEKEGRESQCYLTNIAKFYMIS